MLKFKTTELDTRMRPMCEQVLKQFKLPSFRLLCFFDDENPAEFDYLLGSSHCGFHTPVIGSGSAWPAYVDCLFFDPMGDFAFDNVIYINGRTSSSLPGTVITFAHELQHFMQYGWARKVWGANTLVYSILRDGPPTTIKAWDIPYEKDTMRVSKQVAGTLIGEEVVKAYADLQISAGNDTEKWMFFQNISHSTPFDLLGETKPWVEKYRTALEKVKQSDVDFTKKEWWD